MATRERRDERRSGGTVDAELVGEVDDPLGRGAVVEVLEILADGFPGTGMFVGGARCARELADAATELAFVHISRHLRVRLIS
jgi:hypothetical protein